MNYENLPVRLGAAISEHRKKAGMLQSDLSEKTGLSRVTIYKIENGKVDTKLTFLFIIADALNVPVCELLNFKDEDREN